MSSFLTTHQHSHERPLCAMKIYFTFLLLFFYCFLCCCFYGLTPEIKMDWLIDLVVCIDWNAWIKNQYVECKKTVHCWDSILLHSFIVGKFSVSYLVYCVASITLSTVSSSVHIGLSSAVCLSKVSSITLASTAESVRGWHVSNTAEIWQECQIP